MSTHNTYMVSKYIMSFRRVSTVVLDGDIKLNLQRIAHKENTNLSVLLNRASEEYIREYIRRHENGEGK
jgi:predicted transcriptional regulator